MTWHYVQYLTGLRDLGCDVYYFEDSGEWPYTWDGGESGHDWNRSDPTPNVRYLASVMSAFGFADRWAYLCATDERWYGMGASARRAVVESTDVLLNVSGSLVDPERFEHIARRVYIDTDPVFTQLALAMGDDSRRALVSAHDAHFTFATDLTRVTDAGFDWMPTRQPVDVAAWHSASVPETRRYTTIMNWTSYEPIRWRDQMYGQKDIEFVRFLSVPELVPGVTMEVALPSLAHAEWEHATISNDDLLEQPSVQSTAGVLEHAGWSVVDAISTACGFEKYREYVTGSRGEWTVAKSGYVKAQCGWFSERSACYLASGRPVIAQDTGFSKTIPTGDGLVAFSTPGEAVAAIEDVESRYKRHAEAAYELAREYFAADKVLRVLLDRIESGGRVVPTTERH
jgi:hypothetical protein